MAPNTQSTVISVQRAYTLDQDRLAAWSVTDPSERLELMKSIYSPEVTFNEPNRVNAGPEACSSRAGEWMKDFPGWHFGLAGDLRLNREALFFRWVFGPKDAEGAIEAKAQGVEVQLVDSSQGAAKIRAIWPLVDGASEVKLASAAS